MFDIQENGYDKKSVDEYISKLKNEIMQQKLSILEREQRYLDYKEKSDELENREKNLYKAVKALQDAQKIREEGTKTLYTLRLEQISLLYKKAENLINNIYMRHPEIEGDSIVKGLFLDFQNSLDNTKKGDAFPNVMGTPISSENDSMRILLSKMQDYRMIKDKPREVRFERNQTETKLQIKPVCAESKMTDVDDFLNAQPDENRYFKKVELDTSGFNLEEAVNPKDDLETIMKAFDFFNEGQTE